MLCLCDRVFLEEQVTRPECLEEFLRVWVDTRVIENKKVNKSLCNLSLVARCVPVSVQNRTTLGVVALSPSENPCVLTCPVWVGILPDQGVLHGPSLAATALGRRVELVRQEHWNLESFTITNARQNLHSLGRSEDGLGTLMLPGIESSLLSYCDDHVRPKDLQHLIVEPRVDTFLIDSFIPT